LAILYNKPKRAGQEGCLSLSYIVIIVYEGEVKVKTKEGEGAEFKV
jgi:hypothetical protein